MGKSTFDRRPFDFHYRALFIFEGKVANSDLAGLPVGGDLEAHAVPGNLFPSIQQGPSTSAVYIDPSRCLLA